MGEWIKVAKVDEFEEGKGMKVDYKDNQVALFKIKGEFFVLKNIRQHEDGVSQQGDLAHDYDVKVKGKEVMIKGVKREGCCGSGCCGNC